MSAVNESFKNVGAMAFALFWLATIVLLRYRKGQAAGSISEHAASSKQVALLFGVASLVSAVLLTIFFVKWFTLTFELGLFFNAIIITLWALYAIAGLVPDTKGAWHRIHMAAAVTASVLLLPAMLIIIANEQVSQFARVFTTAAFLIMLFVGYKFTAGKHTSKNLIAHEAVYFLCFDVSILVATYIR